MTEDNILRKTLRDIKPNLKGATNIEVIEFLIDEMEAKSELAFDTLSRHVKILRDKIEEEKKRRLKHAKF